MSRITTKQWNAQHNLFNSLERWRNEVEEFSAIAISIHSDDCRIVIHNSKGDNGKQQRTPLTAKFDLLVRAMRSTEQENRKITVDAFDNTITIAR